MKLGGIFKDILGDRFRRTEERKRPVTRRRGESIARFQETHDPGVKWDQLTRRERRAVLRKVSRQRNPTKGIVTIATRRTLQKVVASKLRAHEDPSNAYRLPVYDDPKARYYARRARQA